MCFRPLLNIPPERECNLLFADSSIPPLLFFFVFFSPFPSCFHLVCCFPSNPFAHRYPAARVAGHPFI
eukprot:m.181992 g.181992  ORF g.181992 m.181992 type:complete len:68 (+) comp9996_c5_seq51:1372-1575(+)